MLSTREVEIKQKVFVIYKILELLEVCMTQSCIINPNDMKIKDYNSDETSKDFSF